MILIFTSRKQLLSYTVSEAGEPGPHSPTRSKGMATTPFWNMLAETMQIKLHLQIKHPYYSESTDTEQPEL